MEEKEGGEKKSIRKKIDKGTIIRILIIFLVIGVSWYFSLKIWKRGFSKIEPINPPRIEIPQTPAPFLNFSQEEVVVFTDQDGYSEGEIIKISFQNHLSGSIWYYPECGTKPFWDLEKYDLQRNQWIPVYFSLPSENPLNEDEKMCNFIVCERTETLNELKSREEKESFLEVKDLCFWPEKPIGVLKITPQKLEEGTYRIGFEYFLDPKGEEGKITYSNEFKILKTSEQINE